MNRVSLVVGTLSPLDRKLNLELTANMVDLLFIQHIHSALVLFGHLQQ